MFCPLLGDEIHHLDPLVVTVRRGNINILGSNIGQHSGQPFIIARYHLHFRQLLAPQGLGVGPEKSHE